MLVDDSRSSFARVELSVNASTGHSCRMEGSLELERAPSASAPERTTLCILRHLARRGDDPADGASQIANELRRYAQNHVASAPMRGDAFDEFGAGVAGAIRVVGLF